MGKLEAFHFVGKDSLCPRSEDSRHRLPHKGTKIIVTEEKKLEKLWGAF